MKTTVIFGANSAIAKSYARIRAAVGDRIILVSRNSEKLQILKQDLEARGSKQVITEVFDLDKIDELEPLIMRMGEVHCVLIAHGVLGNQKEDELSVANIRARFHTNFLSAAAIMTLVASKMERQGYGTIAVISSVAGDRGRQSNYVYGSAKAALSVFADGMRGRLLPKNVHVCLIKPGFVDTPMTKDFKKGLLWVGPDVIASGIEKAIAGNKDRVYLPWFWCVIMTVIRMIPEKIFKKMKL